MFGSLAYVEEGVSQFYRTPGPPFLTLFTEFATPFYKGQLPFILWMKDKAQSGLIEGFQNDLFHYHLSIQANYDRGIIGGTPASTEDKIRIKSNLELIPTLREAYLQMNSPGVDLLNYRRNLTMLTNEEVYDIALGTAVELVPVWIGQIQALPSVWGARRGFSTVKVNTVEVKSIVQTEMNTMSFSVESGRVAGTVDFVAGVRAESFGKIVGEGTVNVRSTINAIERGTLLPRNSFGYLNKEGHILLGGKPAGYWQEYHLLEFGGKSPLRILRGGKANIF